MVEKHTTYTEEHIEINKTARELVVIQKLTTDLKIIILATICIFFNIFFPKQNLMYIQHT